MSIKDITNASFADEIDNLADGKRQKFSLTQSAVERIKHLQLEEAKNGRKDAMLRLEIVPGGCSGFKYLLQMTPNIDKEDTIISAEGSKMLVIDQETLGFIEGGTLDFIEEISGSSFSIKNPNANGGCGCGKSFS